MADHEGTHNEESGLEPNLPARQIGGYRLLAALGRGHNSRVFLAQRPGLARTFALKLLDAGLDETQIARVERGAKAAANLHHPGIVRAVEIGHHEGRLFLVMEHVPGETLEARMKRGPIPWSEAFRVLAGVADAVAVAHRAGVVHRDLKPANIVIDRRDSQPRVLDFGLARDIHPGADLTQKGAGFLGTPAYMGPEQVRGEAADTRTDVYALGAILYEAIGGRPPMGGSSLDALCLQILHEAPQPLRPLAPSLPSDAEALILRCLSKERDARPADAAALARELRTLAGARSSLSSLRVVVGAPSPVLVTLVLLVCACLVLATGWGAWERGRYLRSRQQQAKSGRELVEQKTLAAARTAEIASLRGRLDDSEGEHARAQRELTSVEAELADLRARPPVPAPAPAAPAPAAGGSWSDAEVAALVDWFSESVSTPERALAVRAQLLHDRGRFDACLEAIERARREGAGDPYLLVLEARVHLKRGDAANGKRALQRILQEAPAGSPERLFARVISGDPAGPGLLLKAEKSAPRAGYLRVLHASILRGQALAARRPELAQQALSVAGEAVRLDPTSYQAYAQRGMARFDSWKLSGAARGAAPALEVLGDLRKAQSLHADPGLSLFAAQVVLELQGAKVALPLLEDALRQADQAGHPQLRLGARVQLGAAHLQLGNQELGVRCWVEAIDLSPPMASRILAHPLEQAPEAVRQQVLAKLGPEQRATVQRALDEHEH